MKNNKLVKDNHILTLIKKIETKQNKTFSFGLDDIVCLFNEDYKKLAIFLKNHIGDDEMYKTALDVIESMRIIDNGELFIDRFTIEEVLNDLKEFLKNYNPICIDNICFYNTKNCNSFIELSTEDSSVYLVENINPYMESYDLQEIGKKLELLELKNILQKFAETTLQNNLRKKEVIDWLNN